MPSPKDPLALLSEDALTRELCARQRTWQETERRVGKGDVLTKMAQERYVDALQIFRSKETRGR